jgi:hypothetical protein
MELTQLPDVRGGRPCWHDPVVDVAPVVQLLQRTDIAVMEAGVRSRCAPGAPQEWLRARAGSTAGFRILVGFVAVMPLCFLASLHLAAALGLFGASGYPSRHWRRWQGLMLVSNRMLGGRDGEMPSSAEHHGRRGPPIVFRDGCEPTGPAWR